MADADIEDTYLDLPDIEIKLEPGNVKSFYKALKKGLYMEGANRDDQQLYRLQNYPATIPIAPDEEFLPSSNYPDISYDQVRLVQIANANFKQELGKYNAVIKGQTSRLDPSDTLDNLALKKVLEPE